MIKSRTIHNEAGCPKCHSIFTLFPEIAGEWSFEKNKGISIFETVPGSEKKYGGNVLTVTKIMRQRHI